MAPDDTLLEEATREEIDKKLALAGWVVQDKKRLNLYESLGVAVREMDAFRKLEAPYGAAQNGEVPLGCTDTGIQPLECVMFMRDVTEAKRRKSFTKHEGVLKGKSQAYKEFWDCEIVMEDAA